MTRPKLHATLAGASLLALSAAPGIARAQTDAPLRLTPVSTGSDLVPAASGSEILVVALSSGQDMRDPAAQNVPPAQPATPPAEAIPERAPANPAVRVYPRQADGHGIKLGGMNPSRWAEDWRLMRDPAKRDDILDRLKYLPIDGAGDVYLTLSGELRIRSNYFSAPGLVKDSEYRRENQLRIVGGADLHIGPVRFYGELAHGGLSGHNYAVAGKSRNDLYLQQAFGEIDGKVNGVDFGIRYGRQEFTDGHSGLVIQKDDNVIRSSMQGFRGWASASKLRIDLFDFEQVILGTGGISDDRPDHATRFSGATIGSVLSDTKKRKLFFDPFVWRERNDAIKWGGKPGREVRYYYGARFWGSIDRLTFDWVVNRQSGEYNDRDIKAWYAQIAQTYLLTPKGLAPKPGIHFDYGSGGGSYRTGDLQVAKTPNGGAIAFSYQAPLHLSNLFQVSPNLTISPFKTLDITTEYQRSWRPSEHDAIYRGSLAPYVGSEKLKGNHIGDAIRVQASWKITPRLSAVGRYEYFMTGDLLDRLGFANSHYIATWLSFRF